MAARRLVLVMITLLIASTVAAAVLRPTPPGRGPGAPTQTTTTPKPKVAEAEPENGLPRGRLLRVRISTRSRSLQLVPLRLGDQLALTAAGPYTGLVRIRAYGESERVDRFSAARFDLLPRRRGRATVELLTDEGKRRVIGSIEVSGGG